MGNVATRTKTDQEEFGGAEFPLRKIHGAARVSHELLAGGQP
jgi:hypothetical protein